MPMTQSEMFAQYAAAQNGQPVSVLKRKEIKGTIVSFYDRIDLGANLKPPYNIGKEIRGTAREAIHGCKGFLVERFADGLGGGVVLIEINPDRHGLFSLPAIAFTADAA